MRLGVAIKIIDASCITSSRLSEASDNLEEVMHEASIIFIATPSLIFDQIIKRISNFLIEEAFIISCTKGILDKPFRTLSDILSDDHQIKYRIEF